jgi:hypothetical protein
MAMELKGARGEGFATITADGRVLDSWFLRLSLVVEADKTATVRLTKDEITRSLGHVWTAPWQELSDVLQHWSGAVTCPAC